MDRARSNIRLATTPGERAAQGGVRFEMRSPWLALDDAVRGRHERRAIAISTPRNRYERSVRLSIDARQTAEAGFEEMISGFDD